VVRHEPLEECEQGDVLHAVGRPHDREHDQRHRQVGRRGDDSDRCAPEDQRYAEGDREPVGAQRCCPDGADQASNADRRGHVADRLAAATQDAEGRDHDQDVEASAHERLRHREPDDEARPGRTGDRRQPRRERPSDPPFVRHGTQLDPALHPHTRGGHGCDDQRAGADREHQPCTGERNGPRRSTARRGSFRRGVGRVLPGGGCPPMLEPE